MGRRIGGARLRPHPLPEGIADSHLFIEQTDLARWHGSPFFHMLQTGESLLRRRVTAESEAEFAVLRDYRAAGITDYVAIISRFAPEGVIGEMDCIYSSWSTEHAGGFADAHIATLKRVVPTLALAIKAAALARMTATLMETYLGRDAARRVLSGRIMRGVADRIDAVIWFSDLRGFTRITDTAPEQIIPLLNDYADVIVSVIHAQGGDVLKLIGDGILAIFTAAERVQACAAALTAAMPARSTLAALNERRGRGAAGHRHVSRAARRRSLLGQYREHRAARFHRARTGRQRNEPDRRHVPLGRAAGAGVRGFRQCRLHAQSPRIGRPLRVAWGRAAARAFHAR
jgi:adenylate cyclase